MAHRLAGSFVVDGRFIQDHFPGIGRYTFNLVRALAHVAPEDSFAVLHNPALRNTRYDLGALQHPNLEWVRAGVPTFSLREQWTIPALLRERRAASYHSPYLIMPYRPGCPTVVTLHDLMPIRYPHYFTPWQRLGFALSVRLAARAARYVISVSQATAEDLRTLIGVPAGKIVVIPEAADPTFAPPPASEIARVREQYALSTPYVLSVGINKPHKNLAALIEAWRRADPAGTLVIAGAWDPRYPVEHAGAGTVRLIHDVPEGDLPALYAGATAFVMPSLYEGFGLPVLEAMACGAPVMASNTSSLPEVAGDAALLFDPLQPDALAEALTRVLGDCTLRDELRARGLERAAQFSWERTARETLRVYQAAA